MICRSNCYRTTYCGYWHACKSKWLRSKWCIVCNILSTPCSLKSIISTKEVSDIPHTHTHTQAISMHIQDPSPLLTKRACAQWTICIFIESAQKVHTRCYEWENVAFLCKSVFFDRFYKQRKYQLYRRRNKGVLILKIKFRMSQSSSISEAAT